MCGGNVKVRTANEYRNYGDREIEGTRTYIRFGCRNLCAAFMCWILLLRLIADLMIQPIPFHFADLPSFSLFFSFLFLSFVYHLCEYISFFPHITRSLSVSLDLCHIYSFYTYGCELCVLVFFLFLSRSQSTGLR